MKIHLKTKAQFENAKFEGYSEIFALILRGNGNSGYNDSYLLLVSSSIANYLVRIKNPVYTFEAAVLVT